MSTTTKSKAFPLQDVELLLRDELIVAAETEAALRGSTFPNSLAVAVLAPVPIDSLTAVEIVCAVEPTLGFKPSNATVRAGGYNSVQDALDHLIPRLERQWQKQQGARP